MLPHFFHNFKRINPANFNLYGSCFLISQNFLTSLFLIIKEFFCVWPIFSLSACLIDGEIFLL